MIINQSIEQVATTLEESGFKPIENNKYAFFLNGCVVGVALGYEGKDKTCLQPFYDSALSMTDKEREESKLHDLFRGSING